MHQTPATMPANKQTGKAESNCSSGTPQTTCMKPNAGKKTTASNNRITSKAVNFPAISMRAPILCSTYQSQTPLPAPAINANAHPSPIKIRASDNMPAKGCTKETARASKNRRNANPSEPLPALVFQTRRSSSNTRVTGCLLQNRPIGARPIQNCH